MGENWLHYPRLMGGGGQHFKAGNKITSAPHVGGMATSPLAYGGFPTLQSSQQDHKCSTCGRIGYITSAWWGVPNAFERGTRSQVRHMWADWLHHPCLMGGPQRFIAGNKITSAPHVGGLATSPLPYGGSLTLHSGEQDQTCLAWGRTGYITLDVWGVPNAFERGTRSEVAHMWVDWVHHACHLGVH